MPTRTTPSRSWFDPADLPPPAPSQLTVTFTGLRSRPDGSTVMTARKGATVRVNLQLQGSYADETDLMDAVTPDDGAMYELVLVTTVPDGSDADEDRDVYERSRVPRHRARRGRLGFVRPADLPSRRLCGRVLADGSGGRPLR